MELLIATHNPGKYREYARLLSGLPVRCISPAAAETLLHVDESGASFRENASLKAVANAVASNRLTLADDSGLEVDALQGRPGVHSARYGGPGLTDTERWQLLLSEMKRVPWAERTARFRCVIALATPSGQVRVADGCCEGLIAFQAAGDNGFGYDPIFWLPELGCTMAQLDEETKNQISHRARAASLARPLIDRLARAAGSS